MRGFGPAIDRAIGVFAPQYAARRIMARIATERIRGWEIAKSNRFIAPLQGRATQQFFQDIFSTDATKARNAARYFADNNPIVAAWLDWMTAKIIGQDGIWFEFDTGDKTLDAELKERFWIWSRSVDPTGRMAWGDLCEVLIREFLTTGEAFAYDGTFRDRFVVQPFQPESLSYVSTRQAANGEVIENGIVYDSNYIPKSYLLSTTDHARNLTESEVPADRVIHIFQRLMPSQRRGAPMIRGCGIILAQLETIDVAQTEREKNAAMFGINIEVDKWADPSAVLAKLGLPNDSDEATAAGMTDEEKADATNIVLAPGLARVGPGKPSIIEAHQPSSEWSEARKTWVKGVAARLGAPYSALSGDAREANYSSERAGEMNIRPRAKRLRYTACSQGLSRIVEHWLRDVLLGGDIQRFDPAAVARDLKWRPERWDWVDVKAEATKDESDRRLKLTSWRRQVWDRGDDPDEVAAEIESDPEFSKNIDKAAPEPPPEQPQEPAPEEGKPNA